MAYLVFVFVSLALLIGFVALSSYETQRGVRVFAFERSRLDKNVERVEFILTHVNLSSFLREETRRMASRVAHDIAHLFLVAVRATERLLTHAVRHLRSHHTVDTLPRENTREFVKTLSDFKGHLESTRPEVPDVLE